jgi:hypothetical protein
VDAFQVWDMLTVMALNYPKYEKREEDREFQAKRTAYYIFFYSLSNLLYYVPNLASMGPYISPRHWTSHSINDRIHFFKWISMQKFRWAYNERKTVPEIRAMKFAEVKFVESLL